MALYLLFWNTFAQRCIKQLEIVDGKITGQRRSCLRGRIRKRRPKFELFPQRPEFLAPHHSDEGQLLQLMKSSNEKNGIF